MKLHLIFYQRKLQLFTIGLLKTQPAVEQSTLCAPSTSSVLLFNPQDLLLGESLHSPRAIGIIPLTMLIKTPEFSRRISTWLDEVKDRVITLDSFYTNVTERFGLPMGIETSHPWLSLVVWAKYRKLGDSMMVRDFTITPEVRETIRHFVESDEMAEGHYVNTFDQWYHRVEWRFEVATKEAAGMRYNWKLESENEIGLKRCGNSLVDIPSAISALAL
jgi:hypothetical protein